MHTIDLKNYTLRTDLIIDELGNIKEDLTNIQTQTKYENIIVDEIKITEDKEDIFHKKAGYYKTITFEDITDKDNYKKVETVFTNTLKKLLEELNIKESDKVLIIGLGNEESTPDSLGPKVINHILVTKHLFSLGEVEAGYRETSSFKPNVTGVTGIETKDIINTLVATTKPDFLIIIDALASSSIDRLNRTIQISDSGINPGSGVGNNRKELSKKTLGIPVIAIGIPTVVDAITIVNDTFCYMQKQFSYKIDNQENQKLKLVPVQNQNYKDHPNTLSTEEKQEVMGLIGTLSEEEFKHLIFEVLSPINYNLMVTPKEIDFVIEKLALLVGNGINKSLHNHFNPTK